MTVEERWNWEEDSFTRTRTDTGEVLVNRHLNDDERQMPMIEDNDQFLEG